MKRSLAPIYAATLVSLAFASSAHAGFVNWSYNWSRVPADVVSSDLFGTSKLSLTDEPAGRATNSSDVVATNIRTSSNAPRGNPNNFKDAAFSLTLRLTDDASGKSGTLSFTGVFNGTLSSASADISATWTSPNAGELVLGDTTYKVAIDSYSPPGPPGINNAGSIGATVEVITRDPPPPPSDVPEPTTLALSLLGLSAAGVGAWWKRKKPLAIVAE